MEMISVACLHVNSESFPSTRIIDCQKFKARSVWKLINETRGWAKSLLTHLSPSVTAVKEVECGGSLPQSRVNTGGQGSPCRKPGKPAITAPLPPILPQRAFPKMTSTVLPDFCTKKYSDLSMFPAPTVPPTQTPRTSRLWFRWPEGELPLFLLEAGRAQSKAIKSKNAPGKILLNFVEEVWNPTKRSTDNKPLTRQLLESVGMFLFWMNNL